MGREDELQNVFQMIFRSTIDRREPGRRSRPGHLSRSAWALMGNIGVSSLLGVVFWVVAARLYRAELVGQDAGLIAAMLLLSSLSQLSLGQGIPRLLPQFATHRRRAVLIAYLCTGLLAGLLGIGFVILAPDVSSSFVVVRQSVVFAAVFVAAVMVWNVFTLEDAVLTAVRWAVVVPVENAVFSLLKMGLLFVFVGDGTTHGVLFAWLLATVLVVPAVNLLLFVRLLRAPDHPPSHAGELLPIGNRPRVARYLAFDYVATLLGLGGVRLLPLLVLAILGSVASAYFYVDFTIATAMYSLALAVGTSLVVEGAHDERALAWLARRALLRYAALLAVGCGILAVGAPFLLRPFGTAYVENGTTLLRLLLVGCIPLVVVIIYLGIERVRGRAGRILAVQALSASALVVGAELLIRYGGLPGVGFAWIVAWAITALLILPTTLRVVRPPR